ncbi:MAG: sugar ABC transporter permease [Eubacteriales bacterium]|nr:sugar ABC transporter permease [Eubacteriales bacterium]
MGKLKTAFSRNLKQFVMLIALVVIIVFFQALTKGTLLRPMNVFNLINQNAYIVVLAVGMLMCILSGGNVDLSAGSVVAFVGACAGTFMITWKWDPYLSVLLCLGIGILIGAWQGFWIAYVKLPAFIVTLAGQLVFRGLTLIVLKGLTLSPFPSSFMALSTGSIGNFLGSIFPGVGLRNITSLIIGIALAIGVFVMQLNKRSNRKKKGYAYESLGTTLLRSAVISAAIIYFFFLLANYTGAPVVLITMGIVLIVYSYITSKTVMGRHLYAVGGNQKAARLSGVKTDKIIFLAYVNMSFLAAVAGLIFSARLNSSSPQAGTGFELDAIASCFIGGASAYGGIGTVGGTLIGALIMGVLNNGMSIMGISIDVQQVVKGLVLLAAVAFDVISKQKISLPFLQKLTARRRVRT